MGSYIEVNFFDNSNGLSYEEASEFIKNSVSERIPSFKADREYDDPHGYWGIFFTDGDITFLLGSERSFIDYSVEVKGEKISLSDFDGRLNVLERTTKKNFLFLIETIRRYLESR